eukprot:m.74206 g.74206  ORF g.74206 m.74206 type:complete len:63 (-) comp8443_c0_seq1:315-503(-)
MTHRVQPRYEIYKPSHHKTCTQKTLSNQLRMNVISTAQTSTATWKLQEFKVDLRWAGKVSTQ